MRIEVDRARCDGVGICEGLAPDVFEVGESGELLILADEVRDRLLPDVKDAVSSCPMEALRLVKD